MKINIPFNEWSKQRLKTNNKIATTRTKIYGDIGDRFEVLIDGIIHQYELLAIFPLRLNLVSMFLYHIEGASTPSEFVNVWCGNHPKKGWTPDDMVHVHLFKEVKKMKKITCYYCGNEEFLIRKLESDGYRAYCSRCKKRVFYLPIILKEERRNKK